MIDYAAARRTMVENQLRTYDVTDQRVLAAFESVPREAFVSDRQRAIAYLDRELTARDDRSILLTPMVLARMLQVLDVQPGETVLDVGGAGYGAALLRDLGAEVTTVVADESAARAGLAESGVAGITVIQGSLAAGAPNAPHFDAILVHGAADAEPDALIRQLKDGGRLMIVLGRGRSGRATLFRRIGEHVSRHASFDAAAPVAADFRAKPAFQF